MSHQRIIPPNCESCRFRSIPSNQILGHRECSEHRPCTGNKFWEPQECQACNHYIQTMAYMSPVYVSQILAEFRSMLEQVRTKLSLENSNRDWQYEPIMPYFFADYIHLDPARMDNQVAYTPENDINLEPIDDNQSNLHGSFEENNDISEEANQLEGSIANAGEQHYPDMLNRDTCEQAFCVYEQPNHPFCDDPIHDQIIFHTVNRSPRLPTNGQATQNISKRQRSPSASNSQRTPMALSPLNTNSDRMQASAEVYSLQAVNKDITNNPQVAADSEATPILRHKLPLPKEEAYMCDDTNRTFWKFNPALHTKIGRTKIEKSKMDKTNTFVITVTRNIIYRPGHDDWFEIVADSETKSKSPFISTTNAHTAFMEGYKLYPTTGDIKAKDSKKNYLDATISSDSGTNDLLTLLRELGEECSSVSTGLNEEHILKLFEDEKFGEVNFCNFTSGWTLTTGNYEKFAKDAVLSVKRFKEYLVTFNGNIRCNNLILKTENVNRQIMLHSIAELYYQDELTGKIDLIPEEHRTNAGLSSDLSKGICRMQVAQIKYNVARWMVSKQKVRRDILNADAWHEDGVRTNINFMLKQNLWDADIFPKSAFLELRGYNENKICVPKFLGIKPQEEQKTNVNNSINVSNSNQQPNKKQKIFHQFQKVSQVQQAVQRNPQRRGGQNNRGNRNSHYKQTNKQGGNNYNYKGQQSQRGNRQSQNQKRKSNNNQSFRGGKNSGNKQ